VTTLKRLFDAHPASVGETYLQHTGSALTFARDLGMAAVFCAVHAFLPFLFEKTASAMVVRLHDRMVTHRDRRSGRQGQSEGAAREAA
jgi:hypothetical protein